MAKRQTKAALAAAVREGAAAKAALRDDKGITAETARDPLHEHAALKGLGDLPGIRKDAKGSVIAVEIQAETKTVEAKAIALTKDDEKFAHKLLSTFQGEAGKLAEIKGLLDAARTKVGDIILELAKRAADRMDDHPQWRLAMFDKFCAFMEADAVRMYKKATSWEKQPGVKEPTVREAVSPSWPTYRGQIRRGLKAGYDPRQFANSTAFRTIAAEAEKASRTPRTPAGDVTSAVQGVDDPMVAGVLIKLTEIASTVPEDKRDQAADIISDAMHKLQALAGTVTERSKRTRAGKATAPTAEETHAASM